MESWHQLKRRHRAEEGNWARRAIAHYGRVVEIARGECVPVTTIAALLKRHGLRRVDQRGKKK